MAAADARESALLVLNIVQWVWARGDSLWAVERGRPEERRDSALIRAPHAAPNA